MRLSHAVERHRTVIILATVLLTVAGLWALRTLPSGIYPETAYPRIVVLARSATFDPPQMTIAVTRPLEEALLGLPGLRLVRSRTVHGSTEISLDFRPDADMMVALSQVQSRLAAVRGNLPADAEVQAERLTPSVFPILQYSLTGGDPLALRDLALRRIRPRLSAVHDVADIEVQGGDSRQITALLDPAKLSAERVSVAEVAEALRHGNSAATVGISQSAYRQYSLVVTSRASTAEQIGDVVVRQAGARAVRVRDLGEVRVIAADRFDITTGDGKPAVLLNVMRQPNGNTVHIADGIDAAVREVRRQLPPGVTLESVYDQAALVRASVSSVRDAIVIGGVLAIAVLLLFLGRWRLTLAAGLSLPLALAGSFAAMSALHQSLNLMSLGGLAVAIGLIIDNAVVVVENIERHIALTPYDPPQDTMRRALDEVFGPVTGSTLTTVVVFLPLGLLQGVVGDFFRAFSLALACAVMLSLAVALAFLPAVIGWASSELQGSAGHKRHGLSLEGLTRRYTIAVEWLLGHRLVTLAITVVVIVIAGVLSSMVGTGFLPTMDEGGFVLDYHTPPGMSLSETNRQLGLIETILAHDKSVRSFSRRTGSELGFAATAPNSGDFTVLLLPHGKRHEGILTVISRIRDEINEQVPSAQVDFIQLLQDVIGDLAGAPAPIEVKLFGADPAVVESTAVRIAAQLEGVPGLVDVASGRSGTSPTLSLVLDPARVSQLGLTPADVQDQARAALFGDESGSVQEFDRVVPVTVRLTDASRATPEALATLPISGPNGSTHLAALGTLRQEETPVQLQRETLRPVIRVTGAVSGRDLGHVMRDVRVAVARVTVPAGVDVEFGGQDASQREAFQQLLVIFTLAAGLVLLVMVAQFRSLAAPLVLLIAAPLGLTGAFLALAMTGVPFNVSSFMGLILLIGLVVKNGIILFDAAHRLHAEGAPPRDAMLEAGRLRLRPILMTTLCTLAGLVPLALGLGEGSEMQRPLAIAVIGGLTLSTLVTLLLVPVGLDVTGALGKREPVLD